MSRAEKRAAAQAKRHALQAGYWAEMEKIIKDGHTGPRVSLTDVWNRFCTQINVRGTMQDQMVKQELLIFKRAFLEFWKEAVKAIEEAPRSLESTQEVGRDG